MLGKRPAQRCLFEADHLLEAPGQVVDKHALESEERRRVRAAALLSQLLLQDLERSAGTPQARDGVAKERAVHSLGKEDA